MEEGYAVFAPDNWNVKDTSSTPESSEQRSSQVCDDNFATPGALEPDIR